MNSPMRLHRSRKKGARLSSPAGRSVVCCTRPGHFGNPFVVGGHFQLGKKTGTVGWVFLRSFKPDARFHTIASVAESLEWFERYVREWKQAEIQTELRNKHLACYCKLCPAHSNGKPLNVVCADCQPCHVDVLGLIANQDLGVTR